MLRQEIVKRLAFGLFEADLRSGELWRAGHRVKLPRQPFRVLALLLARPGDIVTREDLQFEIWGSNTTVDFDQAITAAINKIREALGDSAENPRFIQTLTKRGYRFIAPVTVIAAPHPAAGSLQPAVFGSTTISSGRPETAGVEQVESWASQGGPQILDDLHVSSTGSSPAMEVFGAAGMRHREKLSEVTAGQRSGSWSQVSLLRLLLVIAALTASALAGRLLLAPVAPRAPFRVDQITHYVPISLGPPNPESFLTTAVDGNRVLTSVMVNGRPRLSAIDVDTGEVQGIAVPDEIVSNSLADISKDGSKLLLRSQQSTESEQPLWVVPSVGGSGRRIPGVLAHDAAWMPDGINILYATGDELAEIDPNEDVPRAYAKLPGRAFWLRWSPNGKLLRFTLLDPVTHAATLWEMTSRSDAPKPVMIPELRDAYACCGVWLPNGQSYVFQANDDLWQLQGLGHHARLMQLTNGPLRSLSPVTDQTGHRVFFVGLEAPSGLQQFDPVRKEFRAAPAFLADANRIDFSKDGKWVAWTDIHEKLWRARTDGSDKVRLTSDALEVFLAHWSPDGRQLAVMARRPGGVWQIFLVDASGGMAQPLSDEVRNVADPGWSADGSRLVFGREPDLMGKESGSRTLQIINLSTHRLEVIPGSEDLFSPRWSPDGRWIAALTLDQKSIMLYDIAGRHWRRLASTSVADPVWSADSKSIYLHALLADREPILRIQVPDGATRVVADLGNFHSGEVANYFFGGVTPGGEPLVQPRIGTGNLYSLDLTSP